MIAYLSISTKFRHYGEKLIPILVRKGIKVSLYNSGEQYTTKLLSESDACIFVLGDYFEYDITKLTTGVLSELLYCINNRKPIYLYYESQQGPGVYAVEITKDLHLKGIPGTRNTLLNENLYEKLSSLNENGSLYKNLSTSYLNDTDVPKLFDWELSSDYPKYFY